MVERGVAVVVEDDDEVCGLLTEVLSQSGFAVHSASSGQEAVEAVRVHDPDIITMDVGLPDFDGLEASRRIRTFSDAYLIIVTGYADEADALMGFEAGADDYLIKPFRPRELRARIGAMLRRPGPSWLPSLQPESRPGPGQCCLSSRCQPLMLSGRLRGRTIPCLRAAAISSTRA